MSQRACAGARVWKHFKVTYAHFVFCCPNQFHVFVVVFATEVLLFRIQHSLVLLFFSPRCVGICDWILFKQAENDGSVFLFFFLLLPLCAMFYFTFALSVCGFEVTVLDVRRSVAVLFLFLYFSFLFLEVFELYSINISLTVSCSSCFINTSKYDQHTPVFVSSLSELFPRPSTWI